MPITENSQGSEALNARTWHPDKLEAFKSSYEVTQSPAPKFTAGTTISEDKEVPSIEDEVAQLSERAKFNEISVESNARAQKADERYIDEHGIDAFVEKEQATDEKSLFYRVIEGGGPDYGYQPRTTEEANEISKARKLQGRAHVIS